MTGWSLGVGAVATALAGTAVVVYGVLVGRADVAVLGLPLVLTVVWGWFTRPTRPADVEVRRAQAVAHTGRVTAVLAVSPAPGTETVRIRVASTGYRERQAVLAASAGRQVAMSVETARTGVQQLFRVDHLSDGCAHVVTSAPQRVGPLPMTVFPTARPLRQVPLPFRL